MERDEAPEAEEASYLDALQGLREEGFERVETELYVESLDAHLERVRDQPAAAARQRVRLIREAGAVRLHRVQRAGGRTYVDDSPQATVRRGG